MKETTKIPARLALAELLKVLKVDDAIFELRQHATNDRPKGIFANEAIQNIQGPGALRVQMLDEVFRTVAGNWRFKNLSVILRPPPKEISTLFYDSPA